MLGWKSVRFYSSDSREALENWQNTLHEVSMKKCVRITNYSLCWVDSEVHELPTYEWIPNPYTFLGESESRVPEHQWLLALDVAMKATLARWWVAHKKILQFGSNVEVC